MSSEHSFSIKSAEELADKIAPFIFEAHPHDGCTCAETLLVLAAHLSGEKTLSLFRVQERIRKIYEFGQEPFNDVPLDSKEEVIEFWKILVKMVREKEEENET